MFSGAPRGRIIVGGETHQRTDRSPNIAGGQEPDCFVVVAGEDLQNRRWEVIVRRCRGTRQRIRILGEVNENVGGSTRVAGNSEPD